MASVVAREYVVGFALVTFLFALWGFANDVTNPMVSAFKEILLITQTQAALVQTSFYGGYCFMAIPAALIIKRFSYKTGILIGLSLYSIGCLLFLPASLNVPAEAGSMGTFVLFLIAYFVMTCGLSFLETSSNPYILSMGGEDTATARLNLAQSFNPMGSLCGMFTAKLAILARLDPISELDRRALLDQDVDAFQDISRHDLTIIGAPYGVLGIAVLCVFIFLLCSRLPATESDDKALHVRMTLGKLFRNKCYILGVVAQAFYIGCQICTWTFIIQYGTLEVGIQDFEAQTYNIIAMTIFVSFRFICTFMLRFVSPGLLLTWLGTGGCIFSLGAMLLRGHAGIWSIVLISACMSIMFPTIYGIALEGLGDDAKLGSAGLIVAIGGGAVFPPIQAWIIDTASIRASFVVPFVCQLVCLVFGIAVHCGALRRPASATESDQQSPFVPNTQELAQVSEGLS